MDFERSEIRRPAIARADFGKNEVFHIGLAIEPDPEPHPRHVELYGWPSEKDERIVIAPGTVLRIAAAAA